MCFDKCERIGTDRIKISNFDFEIKKDNKLSYNLSENTSNGIKEKEVYKYRDKLINNLTLEKTTYINGFVKIYNEIDFNPNSVLTDYNIQNSTHIELNSAIKILKKKLQNIGLIIKLTNAIFQHLEINHNFLVNYNDYSDVFALFSQQLEDYTGRYGGKYKDNIKDINVKEGILTKWKTLKGEVTKELEIYDKSLQMLKVYNLIIQPISRIEYRFNKSHIRNHCDRLNIKFNLPILTENDDFINSLFIYHLNKDILKHLDSYLENKIYGKLKSEYTAFKNTAKTAKKYSRTEKRNVYEYLINNFWIFSEEIILRILKEHDKENETRNASRDFKKFQKKYPAYKNLEKLNYIRSFFCITNLD